MKKHYSKATCETDYFSARGEGDIVIFRPKGNQLLASTLIKSKEAILEYFRFLAQRTDTRIVIIMPQQRKVRREEYLTFFDMVRSSRISENSVMRLYRALDQFILHILSSDLFFISVDRGRILSMFASLSLACDYRILGEDATFQNPALELGLVPKGGTAWFLKRMLGRPKALVLMLGNETVTAQDALEMGLTDHISPVEKLEDTALSIAERFAALPGTSLRLAKRLVNNTSKDLQEYLEVENQELFVTLTRQKQMSL